MNVFGDVRETQLFEECKFYFIVELVEITATFFYQFDKGGHNLFDVWHMQDIYQLF